MKVGDMDHVRWLERTCDHWQSKALVATDKYDELVTVLKLRLDALKSNNETLTEIEFLDSVLENYDTHIT